MIRRLHNLPEVEQGDFGWCIYEPMTTDETWRVVYYDDDDYWCSDGLDEIEPVGGKYHQCADGSDDKCYLDSGAIVYSNDLLLGTWEVVPYGLLHVLPARISGTARLHSSGWIYAIAVAPDLDMCRLKVGFTERDVARRLAQYRTANPTAVILGQWPGDRILEQAAHRALDGRIGKSEVFRVRDLAKALDAIDRAMNGCAP